MKWYSPRGTRTIGTIDRPRHSATCVFSVSNDEPGVLHVVQDELRAGVPADLRHSRREELEDHRAVGAAAGGERGLDRVVAHQRPPGANADVRHAANGAGHRQSLAGAVEERGRFGSRAQVRQRGVVGEFRLVAHGIDHAQEAERRVVRRAELVPRVRRNRDEVVLRERVHGVADQAPAVSAQHEHRVHVAVALERRVSARGDLEVPQLAGQVVAPEQRLARHVAERHAGVRLVREQVDAFPAEAGGRVGRPRELADGTIAHRTLT